MTANIGVYGLGVMGANLARNFASRGHTVAVFNRNSDVTTEFDKNIFSAVLLTVRYSKMSLTWQ